MNDLQKLTFLLLFLASTITASPATQCENTGNQTMHLKTFGHCENTPVIFIHGGPGDHSGNFEHTTAEPLAKLGYYVITYDRIGTGWSPDAASNEQFTFDQFSTDLHQLITGRKLDKPVLLAHSFGGQAVLEFMTRYPDSIRQAILVATPHNNPQAFEFMVSEVIRLYREQNQSDKLAAAETLHSQLFPKDNNHRYNSQGIFEAFAMAGELGLWEQAELSDHARLLYGHYEKQPHPPFKPEEFIGFVDNENYMGDDLRPLFSTYKDRLCGIYGAEDGLLPAEAADEIKQILSPGRFHLVQSAAHHPYIENQPRFLASVEACLKSL